MTAFGLLCIVTMRCLAVEAEGELSQEEMMALLQKLHDRLSPEQKKMREYQNNRLWAISGDSSEEISGQYWFQRKYFDLKYEIDKLNVVSAQVEHLSDLQRQASILFTEDAALRAFSAKFGVGEECNLSFLPAGISVEYIGEKMTGTVYTAPAGNGTSSILANATYRGKTYNLGVVKEFSYVSPILFLHRSDLHKIHSQNNASCGFLADVYLQPTDVYFYKVWMKEGIVAPVVTGYFNQSPYDTYNHADGLWIKAKDHSLQLGTRIGVDKI